MGVKNKLRDSELSRRDALRLCAAPLGVAAASGLIFGCGEESRDFEEDEGADPRAQVGTADAGVRSVADAGGTTNVSWATGGTKAMNASSYPDPFAAGSWGPSCAVYPAMTLGPCYAQSPARRVDISDGMTGLPVRLSFLVVRSGACSPVPNAEVDIWHTGSNGVYSAFASGICNPNRLPVKEQRFCRGTQVTDANGRADFSTIFPGWYSGRSIHIHFTVRVNGRATQTSQLFFDDLLSDEIMASTEYKPRGKRDTTNLSDRILRGVSLPTVVMSSTKRPDGAMHAWKVLSIQG